MHYRYVLREVVAESGRLGCLDRFSTWEMYRDKEKQGLIGSIKKDMYNS